MKLLHRCQKFQVHHSFGYVLRRQVAGGYVFVFRQKFDGKSGDDVFEVDLDENSYAGSGGS